jgi:drug/metabolite transporter (DMT)-like permease
MLVPILARNGLEPFRTRMLGLMALRGLFNAGAMVFYFIALGMMPLAEISALSFTTPLFVALLAVPVFKEKLGPRRIVSLIVGFSGTLLILRPGVEVISLGAIYALGAAATWGIAIMLIKHMSRTESSVTITLYGMVFLALFTMIPSLFVWVWPTLEQLGVLVALSACGTVGQILFAQALKNADIGLVMPFDFTKLIWASLFGAMFFAEIPTVWTLIGGAVIFAGATYFSYRERSTGRGTPTPSEKSRPNVST